MSTTISDEEKSAITVAREKISEPTQEKVGQDAPRTTPYTVLPPEVRTAISDMARTVVELTLQQKKLLKQVERLEARLDVALENMAHNQSSETSLDTKLVSPQSVCAKTPIHEQIAFDKNTPSDVREAQSVEPKAVEGEQAKTKNPLLKIFGLERHG